MPMTEYEKLLTEATAAILNETPGVIVAPEFRHLRCEDFPAWILAEARQALADAPVADGRKEEP